MRRGRIWALHAFAQLFGRIGVETPFRATAIYPGFPGGHVDMPWPWHMQRGPKSLPTVLSKSTTSMSGSALGSRCLLWLERVARGDVPLTNLLTITSNLHNLRASVWTTYSGFGDGGLAVTWAATRTRRIRYSYNTSTSARRILACYRGEEEGGAWQSRGLQRPHDSAARWSVSEDGTPVRRGKGGSCSCVA